MKRALLMVLALVLTALPVACKTTDSNSQETERKPLQPPPVINDKIPLDQALKAGIDYGGDTLIQVKKEVKKRDQGVAARGAGVAWQRPPIESMNSPRRSTPRTSRRRSPGK
jgi:hypothetical protein